MAVFVIIEGNVGKLKDLRLQGKSNGKLASQYQVLKMKDPV